MWDKRQKMWEYENTGEKEKLGGCFRQSQRDRGKWLEELRAENLKETCGKLQYPSILKTCIWDLCLSELQSYREFHLEVLALLQNPTLIQKD